MFALFCIFPMMRTNTNPTAVQLCLGIYLQVFDLIVLVFLFQRPGLVGSSLTYCMHVIVD